MSGLGRVSSGTSKQSGQSELWTLRDTVLQLQEELLLTRAQLSKANNQLEVWVDLVRKAWMGDELASKQVASIIGLSSDNVDQGIPFKAARNSDTFDRMSLASLRTDDSELDVGTNYLRERQKYLNEQVALHDRQMQDMQNGKRSTATRQLYRNPQPSMAESAENKRVVSATSSKDRSATRNQQLSTFNSDAGQQFPPPAESVAYSNPLRYTQFGLFDVDPTSSATDVSNGTKSKPNSAVRRSERSLKYEAIHLEPTAATNTSAPVPGVTNDGSRKQNLRSRPNSCKQGGDIKQNSRPYSGSSSVVSAYKRPQQQQKMHAVNSFDDDRVGNTATQLTQAKKITVTPVGSDDDEFTNVVSKQSAASKGQFHAGKANEGNHLIKQFEDDVLQMKSLEDKFRNSTLRLQQQLGIDPNGMIY